jgi:beta-1,2-mannobiose phosphorylase / 1,2-beta-oligomannan phosphorylase
MAGPELWAILLFFAALVLACLALLFFWLAWMRRPLILSKLARNPVLSPDPNSWWESMAVFNPAAFVLDGKVHLLYRALGGDGVSRIGHAVSNDGVHFVRDANPAYDPSPESVSRAAQDRSKPRKLSYDTLTYSQGHASGGGWGGSEDPRAVVIDGQVCMTFTAFEGWNNVRMMLAHLGVRDLKEGLFNWGRGLYVSKPGEVQKNWVLFPEKFRGRYAMITNIYPTIEISYFTQKDLEDEQYLTSRFERHERKGKWDTWVRGAGAPPIKTEHGWLLLYHAIDKNHPDKYKVGAMLLDLKDPKKVLYRSAHPILEPAEWYENDWKPGVVYVTGAIIQGEDLIVYYGGGDKYVAAAKARLSEFLQKLMTGDHAHLEPVKL